MFQPILASSNFSFLLRDFVAQDVARHLGIDVPRIEIVSLRLGSLVVELNVLPSAVRSSSQDTLSVLGIQNRLQVSVGNFSDNWLLNTSAFYASVTGSNETLAVTSVAVNQQIAAPAKADSFCGSDLSAEACMWVVAVAPIGGLLLIGILLWLVLRKRNSAGGAAGPKKGAVAPPTSEDQREEFHVVATDSTGASKAPRRGGSEPYY